MCHKSGTLRRQVVSPAEIEHDSRVRAVLCPGNAALKTEARARCARALIVIGVQMNAFAGTRKG
jgi:hypothetical protein